MKRTLFVGILCLLSLCARAGVLEDIVPRPAQAELHKGSLRVSGIAVKYHTTVNTLCNLNGISRNSILRVGKKLRVK